MKLVVDEFNSGIRIDVFLADYMQEFSRSKIQTEIKNGAVFVNSKNIKPSYIIKESDVIEFEPQNLEVKILPEPLELDIIYEDDNMLVVNKPSGMLTHPTTKETSGTLVNGLINYLGDNLSDVNGDFRPGILHRLDRNTSGLLMVAKNNQAHNYLVEKMKNHDMEKKYIAIVKGVILENELVIDKPIGRNFHQPNKMMVDEENGKASISRVKVIKRFQDASLVQVHLITGRTHQIRVHMSYIGHPVYNDTLYGFGKMKIKTEEQVLQSYQLSFPKPFSEEILKFEIPYDDKIKKVLNYLEH